MSVTERHTASNRFFFITRADLDYVFRQHDADKTRSSFIKIRGKIPLSLAVTSFWAYSRLLGAS